MTIFIRADRREMRSLAILLAPLLFVTGCGLGMDNAERLERARGAFAASEFRAAVIDTRNILQNEPENREARLLLGRSSLKLNDAATAEKELRRAVSLGTELGAVAVDLGHALLGLRQYEELLEEIVPEAARTDADRLAIQRLRASALLALHRPAEARAAYQEVLASNADDQRALLGVASSYVAETDYSQARKTIDRALEIDASYAAAHIASGSLYMTTGDHDAAADEFSAAAELAAIESGRGEEIAALTGLVEAQLAARDVAAAKATLARLEKLAPDNLSTGYLTARVAFLEQDYELAQRELQRLLAAAPDSLPAQFLMGAVELQRGNLGQAEMHLSSVVAASPDNADARKLLAEIRLRQNRADEAADILRPLLQAGDTDLGALGLAVRASLEAGEVDSAVGYLRQALARDPGNADIQLDLAAALLAAGEVEEAEALLSASEDSDGQAEASGSEGSDGQAEALLSTSGGSDGNAYRRAFLKVLAPLRRGDATTALAAAQAMAASWPDDTRVRNLVGGIALSTDNTELARESFAAARDLDPDALTAYLNLAKVEIDAGNYDAARTHYEAALERRPDSAGLMVALAQLEARAGDAGAAVSWLEKARAADAQAFAPRLLLARWYVSRRDFEGAEAAASEAVALAAGNAEAHNLLGLARQAQGEAAAALESFRQAGLLDPEEPDYRVNEARAQAALGDVEQAEATLLDGGDLDLGDLRTSVMVASLKAREGDTEAAMKIAKDLQARHPDRAAPYALEAELLANEKQYEQAAQVYEKALSLGSDQRQLALRAYRVRNLGGLDAPAKPLVDYLDRHPEDAEARVVMAQHHQAHGNREGAIAEYREVLENHPDNFVALNNLAWEYFLAGDARAEELARRAFEQSPENGSVADTLGWIQVKNGELEEGVAMLRKAVELSDGNPEVRYHLAAGLAAAGEADEAARILEEVLAAGDGFASRAEAERLRNEL